MLIKHNNYTKFRLPLCGSKSRSFWWFQRFEALTYDPFFDLYVNQAQVIVGKLTKSVKMRKTPPFSHKHKP